MFRFAMVRIPSQAMINGITTANLGKPILNTALNQHQAYISALEQCGVEVIILPAEDEYPDACFIEDAAVVNEKVAIITHPGAKTRQGEVKSVLPWITKYFDRIEHISVPGTLEGGDILRIENHYYIGISQRTNEAGARQLQQILQNHGFECTLVHLQKYLHLKTGVNYIGDNTILVAGEFIGHPAFQQYHQIILTPEEEYAANSLRINQNILTPAGFPSVKEKLNGLNIPIIEVPLSEFQKLDGGLSCLSLRF